MMNHKRCSFKACFSWAGVLVLSLFQIIFFVEQVDAQAQPRPKSPLSRAFQMSRAQTKHKSLGTASGLAYSQKHFIKKSTPEGDYVLVRAYPQGRLTSLQSEIRTMGISTMRSEGQSLSFWIPESRLNELLKMKNLAFVRPEYQPILRNGLVTSQGDQAQRSDLAREAFEVNGSGVKVGVLSNSFNLLGGAELGVANGDLPGPGNPNGFAEAVEILGEFPGTLTNAVDEGRAMLEIIHDVAPGASLAFRTAFLGEFDFAQGILELADANCDVIVDDVGYLSEPFFQDGVIAQAVDQVTAQGVTYLSSAGNSGRDSYESAFRPQDNPVNLSNPFDQLNLGPYRLHDFDPGAGVSLFQSVTVPAGGGVSLSFQWDNPFASASLASPGATADLDLFIATAPDANSILFQAIDPNIGQDPLEIISLTNNGAEAATIFIAIGKPLNSPGADPSVIKYIDLADLIINDFPTNSSTSFGHPNAAGALSIGAAAWFNTPAFRPDLSEALINSFSSRGGLGILFDVDGNRLNEPEVRVNPAFVSADGANTTFFGQDINIPINGQLFDEDNFPNFFGTSASAPHAAAAVALMLELAGNELSPAQVREILSNTAQDMDDPFTPGFDSGFDFQTGAGFVRIDAALEVVSSLFPDSPLIGLRLIDAESDAVIQDLEEGLVIDLANLNSQVFSIEALLESGFNGSVVFALDGPVSQNQTENIFPFALFGDNQGDFQGLIFSPGAYEISVTPFEGKRASGNPGETLSINFEVINSEVDIQFTLINASSNQAVRILNDQDNIDLNALGTGDINIKADVLVDSSESVVFTLNGPTSLQRTENVLPFALFGDSNNGTVFLPGQLVDGNYTLQAQAFSQKRGGGTLLADESIQFSVSGQSVNGASSPPPNTLSLVSYPNPSPQRVNFEWQTDSKAPINAVIYDERGKTLLEKQLKIEKGNNFQMEFVKKGIYYVHIIQGKAKKIQKIIIE